MGELGEAPKPTVSKQQLIPDISEHAKIAEAAKREYASLGGVLALSKFPKEELDTLYLQWVDLKHVETLVGRLGFTASSGTLPDFEKRDLRAELKGIRGIVEPISTKMVALAEKEKIRFWDLHALSGQIDEAHEDFEWLEQLVALGEVLAETRDDNPDAKMMRRKIGQWAWEEMLNAFSYKKLHYAAGTGGEVTTEDPLDEQKGEFRFALQRKPWGERQTDKNRKLYQGIRKRIGRTEEGIEILKNLKIVWDCARGAIPEGVSAVDIISASESALQGLDSEGAFDWDPEELEEEGEGEEAEE